MGKGKTKTKKTSMKTPKRRDSRRAAVEAAAGDSPAKRPGPGDAGKKPRAAPAVLSESTSAWPALLAGLLIFLIATPAVVAPYGQKDGYDPNLHMAAYIQVGAMIILSLFWLSTFFRRRMQIVLPRAPVLLPLLVFYGWAMLSVLWADSKYEAVGDALDWTGAFLCGLLALLLLRDVKRLRALLFFVMIGGVLMALLGVGQYLFAVDWVQQHLVPAATFSNKNMAGQYSVLTLPIAAAFFLFSRVRWKTWLLAAVISLFLAHIFYARSRGVFIGLLVEVAVFSGLLVYLKLKARGRLLEDAAVKAAALAASVVLFSGLAYLTPAMFGNAEAVMENSLDSAPPELLAEHGGEVLEHVLEYETSAADRFAIWGNSAPMFKEHFLIGVGLGNWTIHYATHQSWFQPDLILMTGEYHANAHNDYLEILCELGVIGFALFLWVVVSLLRLTGRLLSSRDEACLFLALPLVTAIAGIAVNAVFSFPLKQPLPVLMLLVYVAVLSNLYGAVSEKGREHVFRLPSAPVRSVVGAILIFAAISLFALQYNWYRSEIHYRNSLLSLENGRYKDAYDEAALSRASYPLRNDLLWLQAQYLMNAGDSNDQERGVAMLEEMARVTPYSTNTLKNLATAYDIVGSPPDELATLERLVGKQPINLPLKHRYAFLLLAVGEPEEALKAISLYRRNWQYDWELAGKEIQLEEQRMNRPDHIEGWEFQTWKLKRKNKGVRLVEIDRDIERIKRRIKEGAAPSGNDS